MKLYSPPENYCHIAGPFRGLMDLIELLLQTDEYLTRQVAANLVFAYLIIFLVIFAESGIILCPFLPGDGFLFSVGVIAASTGLNFYIVVPLCILAAILGFMVNYFFGRVTGAQLLKQQYSWFNRFYMQTHIFMQKRGNRAVILSRFFPIIRTYLPFVAGMARMDYRAFMKYTVVGAFLWVLLFTTAGFLAGEIPWVQEHYGLIFLALVILTLIPLVFSVVKRLVGRKPAK